MKEEFKHIYSVNLSNLNTNIQKKDEDVNHHIENSHKFTPASFSVNKFFNTASKQNIGRSLVYGDSYSNSPHPQHTCLSINRNPQKTRFGKSIALIL